MVCWIIVSTHILSLTRENLSTYRYAAAPAFRDSLLSSGAAIWLARDVH